MSYLFSVKHKILLALYLLIFSGSVMVAAAQEEAKSTIQLKFEQQDGENICKATLLSNNAPVPETDVHFYVKRMYSLLPIGKGIATDENGESSITFPKDLPGDQNGIIIVVARVEDDDNLGNVESQAEINWGVIPTQENEESGGRSLSASREKAPVALILVSNTIIVIIWGTILYVIFQVIQIRKSSRILKTKTESKS